MVADLDVGRLRPVQAHRLARHGAPAALEGGQHRRHGPQRRDRGRARPAPPGRRDCRPRRRSRPCASASPPADVVMSQSARTSSSLPRWVTIACMLAWRSSWPSPNGVKGLRMLLEATEQLTPCSVSRLSVDHVARHVVVGVAAAEIEVGRRSAPSAPRRHRPCAWPPCPGPAGGIVASLADMADGDAAAPSVLLGEIADQQRVEILGGGAAVEMHVDVDVELARHLEDAADLRRPVGVVVGRGADDCGAVLAAPRPSARRCRDCWSGPPAA